jgi:hypothetical protein
VESGSKYFKDILLYSPTEISHRNAFSFEAAGRYYIKEE